MHRDKVFLVVLLSYCAVFCFHRNLLAQNALSSNAAHEHNNIGVDHSELLVEMGLAVSDLFGRWRHLHGQVFDGAGDIHILFVVETEDITNHRAKEFAGAPDKWPAVLGFLLAWS